MNQENNILKQIIETLNEKIEIAKKGYRDDYIDGVIDGLLIAIEKIEAYNENTTNFLKTSDL